MSFTFTITKVDDGWSLIFTPNPKRFLSHLEFVVSDLPASFYQWRDFCDGQISIINFEHHGDGIVHDKDHVVITMTCEDEVHLIRYKADIAFPIIKAEIERVKEVYGSLEEIIAW